MELALATAVSSVVLGLVAAVAAESRLWVLAPVRAFAVVAVASLAFAGLGGVRAAVVRAAGLCVATSLGIALVHADQDVMANAGPWINAAVAGLLFHVLLHDVDDRDVPAAARPLEAIG